MFRELLVRLASQTGKLIRSDFRKSVEFFNVGPKDRRKRVVTLMTCYNQYPYTRRGIRSYYDSIDDHYDYVLILLDDASTDETKESTLHERSCQHDFGYVRFKRNQGLTRSWNYGLECAIERLGADYVVLANNDVIIPKGSIRRLIDGLQAVEGPAMCGPLTNAPGVNWRSQDIRLSIGNYIPSDNINDIERISNLVSNGKWLNIYDLEKNSLKILNGFFWAGRSDIFSENCYKTAASTNYYFNPFLKNYGNETEFQTRIARSKKAVKMFIASNVFIFHYKDISQKKYQGRKRKAFYGFFRAQNK